MNSTLVDNVEATEGRRQVQLPSTRPGDQAAGAGEPTGAANDLQRRIDRIGDVALCIRRTGRDHAYDSRNGPDVEFLTNETYQRTVFLAPDSDDRGAPDQNSAGSMLGP